VLFRSRVLQPLREGGFDLATDAGFGQLMTALTKVWGLPTSIALYGFLVGLLGFEPLWFVPLIVGAAVLLYTMRPWHPGLPRA
jgi:hypothetical protein